MMSRVLQGVTLLLLLAFAAALAVSLVREAWGPPGPGPIAAYLEIAPEPPKLVFETAAWKQEARRDYEAIRATEAQRIRYARVLRAALAGLQASGKPLPTALRDREDPEAWLREHLVVELPERSHLMRVGLRGDLAPAERAEIINVVVDAYMQDINFMREEQYGRNEVLRQLVDAYRKSLRQRREAVEGLVQKGADAAEVAALRDEIGLLEEVGRDIGRELMRIEFERDANPRILIVDRAVPIAP